MVTLLSRRYLLGRRDAWGDRFIVRGDVNSHGDQHQNHGRPYHDLPYSPNLVERLLFMGVMISSFLAVVFVCHAEIAPKDRKEDCEG